MTKRGAKNESDIPKNDADNITYRHKEKFCRPPRSIFGRNANFNHYGYYWSQNGKKSFLRYIKLTSTEYAKLLKGHWEERKTKALSVA